MPSGPTPTMADARHSNSGDGYAHALASALSRDGHDLRMFLEILRKHLSHCIDTGEQATLALAADILAAEHGLAEIVGEAPDIAARLAQRVDGRLADALLRIQYQDTVKQQTRTVIAALQQLERYVDCAAQSTSLADATSASELLHTLYASYVSEHQRELHNTSLRPPQDVPPAPHSQST